MPTYTKEDSKKNKSEQEKSELAQEILKQRDYFEQLSRKQRDRWEDLWELYLGQLPPSKSKALSQNFIPKVHQAVETMASFLVGNEPTLFVVPRGADDDDKALFMNRILEYSLDHELHIKPKFLSWVKSCILFGVGVIKIGWDAKEDKPFSYVVNIGDFYADPYEREINNMTQVIERLVLPVAQVEEMYGLKDLKPMTSVGTGPTRDSTVFDDKEFDSTDRKLLGKVEVLECWKKDTVVTVVLQPENEDGKVKTRGFIVRERKNKYGFIPYISVHYKESPLPNRFYTIGAIEPVMRIQKRINSSANQIVDITNLIMSPPALVRKAAGINPRQIANLVPGKNIDVGDIDRDIRYLTTPDVTGSAYRLLAYLDGEFQKGTSVTDLRQGVSSADTATEARLNQANLNATTVLVKENIEDAIGQFGKYLAKVIIQNLEGAKSMRVFDPEDIFQFEFLTETRMKDPITNEPLQMGPEEQADIMRNGRVIKYRKEDIDGDYDINVKADSTMFQSKEVLRKQLIDFAQFLSTLGVQIDTNELAQAWGDLSGIPNARRFIENQPQQQMMAPSVGPGGGESITPTQTSQGLTGQAIEGLAGATGQQVSALTQ